MNRKDIDDGNAKAYRSGAARRGFTENVADGLWPVEKACLALLPENRRQAVLDLGVGGGRTTPELARMFQTYLGIDYSPVMVEQARQRFPGQTFEVMDARDLVFREQFDCVVFSYNGLDYIEYADRADVQRRIYEALRPGGLFVFSTHNLGYPRRKIWETQFLVRELARLRSAPRQIANRLRNFRRQEAHPEMGYSIVNDPGIGFSLLTVYVDVRRETEILEGMGFKVASVSDASYSAPWIYIAARK